MFFLSVYCDIPITEEDQVPVTGDYALLVVVRAITKDGITFTLNVSGVSSLQNKGRSVYTFDGGSKCHHNIAFFTFNGNAPIPRTREDDVVLFIGRICNLQIRAIHLHHKTCKHSCGSHQSVFPDEYGVIEILAFIYRKAWFTNIFRIIKRRRERNIFCQGQVSTASHIPVSTSHHPIHGLLSNGALWRNHALRWNHSTLHGAVVSKFTLCHSRRRKGFHTLFFFIFLSCTSHKK